MNSEDKQTKENNQCWFPEFQKARTGNHTVKINQSAQRSPVKQNVQSFQLSKTKNNKKKLRLTKVFQHLQDTGAQNTDYMQTVYEKRNVALKNADAASESPVDPRGVGLLCTVSTQRKKRNRSQHNLNNLSKRSDLGAEDEGQVRATKKRKRKNRGLKNRPVDKMEKPDGVQTTNGNYPKECSSSKTGFSCNWKNLCQTLSVNKPTSVTVRGHQTEKGKTTAPHSPINKSQYVSKTTSSEIWFDGVDKDLLEPHSQSTKTNNENRLVKDGSFKGLTNAVAMDCEMVGIRENGTDSMLARVSIVNLMGNCIYDKYVRPTEPVTNYRTPVSGIRPSDLEKGEEFKVVQKEVSDILNKRILVGHAVHNDLKVLFLAHPRKKIRDTAMYQYFKKMNRGNTPSLKWLSEKLLGVKVQEGEHNSVQDAQAAMRLYTMHKIDWEAEIKKKLSKRKNADGKDKSAPAVKALTHSPTARKFSKLKL